MRLQPDASASRSGRSSRFAQYDVRSQCVTIKYDFTAGSAAACPGIAFYRAQTGAADIRGRAGSASAPRIFAGFMFDSLVYGERFDRALEGVQLAAERVFLLALRVAIETHGGVAATGDVLHHSATVLTRIDTTAANCSNRSPAASSA
ncbi:MAG: hypothetical protein V8T86_07905 [Victivallis sp.]